MGDRLQRLQAVMEGLATALDADRIASIVVEHGVAAMEARTGGVFLVEPSGTHAYMVRAATTNEAKARFARIDLALPSPLAEAIRTGEPIVLGDHAAYAQRFPESEARTRGLVETKEALVCLPLKIDGASVGALTFAFVGEHRFLEEEVAFLELLGEHCSKALERARLIEKERAAAARLRVLADASRAFAAAQLDLRVLVDELAARVIAEVADGCTVLLVSSDGERLVPDAIRHRDPEAEAAIRTTLGHHPVPIDLQTMPGTVAKLRKAVLLPAPDQEQMIARTKPEYRDHLRRFPVRSILGVPIEARGRLLGIVVLNRTTDVRPFDLDDQTLTQELADRAGLAMEQARLFHEAQAATARAEDASRLKDEFLATVGHELRTPLAAILGWVALVKRRRDEASIDRAIEVVERSARSQLRIIEDLLDVARIVRGQLRLDVAPVDLASLAAEVVDALRPAANAKKIALSLDAAEPCVVRADAERLRQILWNLVSNGVKFTQRDGHVWVTVARVGDDAVARVRDDGRGIESAFLPHVFERFRQAEGATTRTSGGLGLGLAIVRDLTELHGGTVTATSEGPGKGSSFTVTIPRVESVHEAGALRTTGTRPTALAGMRVLVVDDDPDGRETIEHLLVAEGATVVLAASADEALHQVRARAPDVLVSDVAMPEKDGHWLARALSTLQPSLPKIALSAFAGEAEIERSLTASFVMHLAKPVDPDALIEAIASFRTSR